MASPMTHQLPLHGKSKDQSCTQSLFCSVSLTPGVQEISWEANTGRKSVLCSQVGFSDPFQRVQKAIVNPLREQNMTLLFARQARCNGKRCDLIFSAMICSKARPASSYYEIVSNKHLSIPVLADSNLQIWKRMSGSKLQSSHDCTWAVKYTYIFFFPIFTILENQMMDRWVRSSDNWGDSKEC